MNKTIWFLTSFIVTVTALLSYTTSKTHGGPGDAKYGGFLFPWTGVKQTGLKSNPHDFNGVDFETTESPQEFQILAPKDGYIIDFFDGYPDTPNSHCGQWERKFFANYIVMGHGKKPDGNYDHFTLLYHLRQNSVIEAGFDRGLLPTRVRLGQPIGWAGNTGESTHPHLHMEVSEMAPKSGRSDRIYICTDPPIEPAPHRYNDANTKPSSFGFEEDENRWYVADGARDKILRESFNWTGIQNPLCDPTSVPVILYNHIDFGGECLAIFNPEFLYNVPSYFHVSSIYVNQNWVTMEERELHLYSLPNALGKHLQTTHIIPDLVEYSVGSIFQWNDNVRSLHNSYTGAAWLLEMSIADKPPLGTDIHVRVQDPGGHDALRICFNGDNCQETGATELYYYWPTYLEEEGAYAITVERRLLSHNQNWENADVVEFAYYLTKHPQYTACSLVTNGATLTSNSECLGVIEDVGDLMPVHWDNRPDLRVCAKGNMMAWVYDGVRDPHGNYQGVPKVVEKDTCLSVGSNVSSIDLKDASAPPYPNPLAEFEVDEHTVHLMHLNGSTIDEVTGMSASIGGGVSVVDGVFGTQAYHFPNPTDGPGLTYPAINVCPMTFEAWVNRGTGGAFRVAGQQGLWILAVDGNKPKIEVWHPTGSVWVTGYESMLENTWHNIMWTYDCDGQVVLYMDQKYVGSVTIDQPPWSNNYNALEIGAVEGIYRFNGDIDEVRISNTVRVPQPPQPPRAVIYASPTSGYRPLQVHFTDQSTGYVTDWLWEFGDGSTSTIQDPSHIYNASGNYTVTLTVSSTIGIDTSIWPNLVHVEDLPPVSDRDPWADFTNPNYIVEMTREGNNLWAATEGGVLVRDTSGGLFVKYTTADSGLADNNVLSVAIDAAGRKWFGTTSGLSVLDDNGTPWDKTDDSWTTFTTADGLGGLKVFEIDFDADGRKWLAENVGVTLLDDNGTPFDKADDQYQTFQPLDGLICTNRAQSLAIDASGRKWIGCGWDGLSLLDDGGTPFDKGDDQWQSFTVSDGMASTLISSIAIDASGKKWIGSWSSPGGLMVLDDNGSPLNKADDQWQSFFKADSGLINDGVNSVVIDAFGDKWITTNGGVSVLDDNDTPFSKVDDTWQSFTKTDGLAAGSVFSWQENKTNDTVIDAAGNKWFGTYGGGISKLNDNGTPLSKADDMWQTMASTSGLAHNNVGNLVIDSAGNKWLATHGGGLSVLDDNHTTTDKNDDQWVTFSTSAGDGVPADIIYGLVIDAEGRKWLTGHDYKVSVFDDSGTPFDKGDDQWMVFNLSDGLPGLATGVAIDQSGYKWFSSLSSGVGVLDDNGTPFNKSDDQWVTFTAADGLADNTSGVFIDAMDRKWFNTREAGISVLDDNGTPFNKSDDQWVTFTVSDGLPHNLYASVTFFDASGRVWFGAVDGGVSVLDYNNTLFNKSDDNWINFASQDGLIHNRTDLTNGKGTVITSDLSWIGTRGGLSILDDGGSLFNKNNDSWNALSTADGLASNSINAFVLDNLNILWLGTRGGLSALLDTSGTPPMADVDASPTDGFKPLQVQFTDLSAGYITDWLWDFGDGYTSSEQNPSHTYGASGYYTVTLSVSGLYGTDTKVLEDYITVNSPVTARFSADRIEGITPVTVNFTNRSTGNYDTCMWDFGDGGTSSDCNDPSHIYTMPGTYTVELLVNGIGGTDSKTRTDLITVYELVVANFAGSPINGIAPLSIKFNNLSVGDYNSCSWDFGDGGTSSDCENPSHEYTQSGSYTVKLVASGQGGTDSKIQTDYIVLYEPVVAKFTGSPTSGISPLTVQFTNLSVGHYNSCSWDFGDGGISSACNGTTHVYMDPGKYDVSLTVNGPGGTDDKKEKDCVVVESNRTLLPIILNRP